MKIQLVRLNEVCGKVLSEKMAISLLKQHCYCPKFIDEDHQNSCLFTNKGHLSLPLWVLIGVLSKFHKCSNKTLGIDFNH